MRKILFILLLAPFALKSQTVNTFRDSTWFKRGVRFDSTLVFSKGAGVGKVWTSNANGTGSWQTFSSAGVTQGALDDSISDVRAIRKVDTIYKSLDSIVFKIKGVRYAVLDSTGGGVQTLYISGDTLSISGGNSVVLPVYVQVDSATVTSYDVLNSQNAPPVSPNVGDVYLVGNTPSGAWVGHAKDIAEWNGSAWIFTDGVQGDFLYNSTTALTYIFRSGNWVQTTGIPILNNGNSINSGLRIGTNNLKSLTFETNNVPISRFDSIGNFYLYNTPNGDINDTFVVVQNPINGKLSKIGKSNFAGGGGGGSPAGSDTQIQYNNAGAFGADSNFYRDLATNTTFIANSDGANYLGGLQSDNGTAGIFSVNTSNGTITNVLTDVGNQKIRIGTQVGSKINRLTLDRTANLQLEMSHTQQSAVTFTGSGLDDLTLSGTFSGTYPTTYTVTVSSTGTPDTFDWNDGTNSGTGVSMSTSPTLLSNGISITFGADTGHTLSDSWTWTSSYVNQNVLDFSNNDYKFKSALGDDTFSYEIGDNLLGLGVKGSLNIWQKGSDLGFSGFNNFNGDFGLSNWLVLGGSNIYGTQITSESVSIGSLNGGNGTSITIDDVNEQITISNLPASGAADTFVNVSNSAGQLSKVGKSAFLDGICGGGSYIPLSGTEVGSPVTGDVDMSDLSMIKNVNQTRDNGINFEGDLTRIGFWNPDDYQYKSGGVLTTSSLSVAIAVRDFSLNEASIQCNSVYGIKVIDNIFNRGLTSNYDFTANIDSLDYTQKKYVDSRISDTATQIRSEMPDVSNLATITNLADTSTALRSLISSKVSTTTLTDSLAKKTNKLISFNTYTTSDTLRLSDADKVIEMNVGTANNLVIPNYSDYAFPVGTQMTLIQIGAGQTTLVPASGVTVHSASSKVKLSGQYSGATLIKKATNEWYLFGDITN